MAPNFQESPVTVDLNLSESALIDSYADEEEMELRERTNKRCYYRLDRTSSKKKAKKGPTRVHISVPDLNLRLAPPKPEQYSTTTRTIVHAIPAAGAADNHQPTPKKKMVNNEEPPQWPSPPRRPSSSRSSLMLFGCTRCFMYVMVPENEAFCPKCNKVLRS